MPEGVGERRYFKPVGDGGAIRVRFTLDRGKVLAFTAQLEIWTGERWHPVVGYDSAHGRPHRDVLDWSGRVIRKDWLAAGRTNNEALQRAIDDLVTHAEEYRAALEERRSE